MLLDLEKEVVTYASDRGLSPIPNVGPAQLHGLEINPYARELAQVVIWIGYLQWMHYNGFKMPDHPVLTPIETIRQMDAILDLSDPEHPKEPEWPEAEFIVGNPPFLGGNRIRQGLGDEYVEKLFALYENRVPGFSDLCCYWFEKARDMLTRQRASRAGLLATQGIRGGANREVLKRIKESGDIFFAISDRDWILDGANVHVSLIGFDRGIEATRTIDERPVESISPDLTSGANLTAAKVLRDMQPLHLEGVKKGADFEVTLDEATEMLRCPNPNGRPNSDVIRPYFNGTDLLSGDPVGWIIYFPASLSLDDACAYEAPFERIKARVFPKYGTTRRRWWQHERPRPEMPEMLRGLPRYVVTVKHSKHRLFVWQPTEVLVSNAIEFFNRGDDFFFGILQSSLHEKWARRQATQLRERESGLRYTPSSCFETFPFPVPPADGTRSVPATCAAIAAAAKELDDLRSRWLNPPEWTKTAVLEFPGSVEGPWTRYIERSRQPPAAVRGGLQDTENGSEIDAASSGRHAERACYFGTVRWPRIVPKDADCAASLKKRTLTNLYNQRPAWLDLAHKKLDAAVFAAYGWDPSLSDEELLERLLRLNLGQEK